MRQGLASDKLTCLQCQNYVSRAKAGYLCPGQYSHALCEQCVASLTKKVKKSEIVCPSCSRYRMPSQTLKLSMPPTPFQQKTSTIRFVTPPDTARTVSRHFNFSKNQVKCSFHSEHLTKLCLDPTCLAKRVGCGKCIVDAHARCRSEMIYDANVGKQQLELSEILSLKEDFPQFFIGLVKEAVRAFESKLMQILDLQLKDLKAHIVDLGQCDLTTITSNVDKLRFDYDSSTAKIKVNLKEESKFKVCLKKFDEKIREVLAEELSKVSSKFGTISFDQLYERRYSKTGNEGMYEPQTIPTAHLLLDETTRPLSEVHVASMTASEFEALINLHHMLDPLNQHSRVPGVM
jgi:hypothetical protein